MDDCAVGNSSAKFDRAAFRRKRIDIDAVHVNIDHLGPHDAFERKFFRSFHRQNIVEPILLFPIAETVGAADIFAVEFSVGDEAGPRVVSELLDPDRDVIVVVPVIGDQPALYSCPCVPAAIPD